MDRRERKKQETRQRLLKAAWTLFQERGYDHTTVKAITEAADVAKGTFFNYFDTKEAIVDHIVLWRVETLANHMLGADSVPGSAVERIKLLVAAMAVELNPSQGLLRHIVAPRMGPPGGREGAHRLGSIMYELVREGQDGGEIRDDIDPGLVTHVLMTAWFHNLRRWWHESGEFPREEDLMRTVDVLMEGLGGVERRSS